MEMSKWVEIKIKDLKKLLRDDIYKANKEQFDKIYNDKNQDAVIEILRTDLKEV